MSVHRICPTTGLRQYKRHEADRAVTIASRQAAFAQVPISSFRCAHCNRWHLSSMSQIEYRVRQLVGRAA